MNTQIRLLTTLLFLLLSCFNASAGIGDYDDDGWTILTPSGDSRLVYVSSSEGNDSNDGLSPQTPKATIDAANLLIRNNQPDWLMLKRGDTFAMPSLGSWKSGRSAAEPLVMTYYGGSGPRPIIKMTGSLINWNNPAPNHTAFVGLDLYRAISDPDSPEFTNSGSGSAFRFIPGQGNNYNTLIEDCLLRYCEITIQGFGQVGYFIHNFYLRRNVVVNTWGHGSSNDGPNAQGMFIEGVNNILIEENLFDHNGWNEVVAGALANQFNHNIYMGHRNDGEIVIRGNIISRGSANGVQLRSGGHATMNAFVANAIGMNLGYTEYPLHYSDITRVNDNVFTDGRPQVPDDVTPPQTGGIWGIWKQLINDLSVNDNIVANILDSRGTSLFPYRGMTADQFGFGNIGWNWINNNHPETDPGWTDPSRNADSFGASMGLDNWQGFINAASARGPREMPYDLSAYAYVNYIREGFDRAPVSPPWFSICDDVSATGVSLSSTSLEVPVNETQRLTATVSPSDACDHTILWSSEDDGVATVDERGIITPVAEGTTVITATTRDGGLTDTCTVTITPSTHTGPINVALGKTATADSNHNVSASAAAAVDGNYALLDETRWVSANTAWPHWLQVDLGESYIIDRIRFWSGSTQGYANPFFYNFQYLDGDQWVNILERPDNASAEVDESFSPVVVESGIVRLYGTGGSDSLMRVFELEVYGIPGDEPPADFATAIGASPTGETGHYNSDWFGNFIQGENFNGWIAHEGLGWLHTGTVESSSIMWIWSVELDTWFYTSGLHFPWLMTSEETWLYYESGYVFNTKTESWTSVIPE